MINRMNLPGRLFISREIMIFLIIAFFLTVLKTVIDLDPGTSHQNHSDTISTVMSGNCPCGYGPCNGCDGKIAITLQITSILTPLPTFWDPATPDLPAPHTTTFPTLQIPSTGQAPATIAIPTLVPTLVPEEIPTLTSVLPEYPIRARGQ